MPGNKEVAERNVANEDWPPTRVNQDSDMTENVASPDRPETPPFPMPTRWGAQTPCPVPVTPGKGSKKRALAVGTPKPTRVTRLPPRRQTGVPSQGWTSGAALVEVMAAITVAEERMEEKAAEREARGEKAAAEREAQLAAQLTAREERIVEGINVSIGEVRQWGTWETEQWRELGEGMAEVRERIAGIGKKVEEEAQKSRRQAAMSAAMASQPPPPPQPQQWTAAPPPSMQRAAAEKQRKAPPPPIPVEMEGVVATRDEPDDIEDFLSDMEDVKREGLYQSQHEPTMGETHTQQSTRPKTNKEKGKGKAPTPVVPCSILKRLEMAVAEKVTAAKEAEEEKRKKKAEDKAGAMKRWEEAMFTEMKHKSYSEAANAIKAMAYEEGNDSLEERATTQRIAHKAGMRALENRWEDCWDRTIGQSEAPCRQTQQQQQQRSQPRAQARVLASRAQQPQQQQRPEQQKPPAATSWAQRMAAAVPLPQTDQFKRVGRNGRAEKKPTGLEPIKRLLPWEERMVREMLRRQDV